VSWVRLDVVVEAARVAFGEDADFRGIDEKCKTLLAWKVRQKRRMRRVVHSIDFLWSDRQIYDDVIDIQGLHQIHGQ
jgi:hypothetical protein